jgi:hypothetical protein
MSVVPRAPLRSSPGAACTNWHRTFAQARRVQVSIEAAADSAWDELLKAAHRLDARRLVLGARGDGFLRRRVLGATSEQLMRRSARTLPVVRQSPQEPWRLVLVEVDFSPWSRAASTRVRRVAPHARPVVLTVFQVPFEERLNFAGVDAATTERYWQQARVQALQRLHALADEAGLTPGAVGALRSRRRTFAAPRRERAGPRLRTGGS